MLFVMREQGLDVFKEEAEEGWSCALSLYLIISSSRHFLVCSRGLSLCREP